MENILTSQTNSSSIRAKSSPEASSEASVKRVKEVNETRMDSSSSATSQDANTSFKTQELLDAIKTIPLDHDENAIRDAKEYEPSAKDIDQLAQSKEFTETLSYGYPKSQS